MQFLNRNRNSHRGQKRPEENDGCRQKGQGGNLIFFELMPCARGSDGHQNVVFEISYSHILENR